MSVATLARCCGTRGFHSLRSPRRPPAASGHSVTAPATQVPRRYMGVGGGSQPISRSMEAELWQGHPKEPEGWETTIQITYAATVVIFALMGFAPDTSIKTVSEVAHPHLIDPFASLYSLYCIKFQTNAVI